MKRVIKRKNRRINVIGPKSQEKIILKVKRNKRISSKYKEDIEKNLNLILRNSSTTPNTEKNYGYITQYDLNRVLTRKGILVRMGKGKGKEYSKGRYMLKEKAYYIIIIPENKSNTNEASTIIRRKLKNLLKKYTLFDAYERI